MAMVSPMLFSRRLFTLTLGLLLLLATGCQLPQRMADRVMTAPNVRANCKPGVRALMESQERMTKLTNVYVLSSVAVGPPTAKLQVMELAPGDYHVKVDVKVEARPGGKHYLTMNYLPNPTFGLPMSPLPERGTVVLLHGYMVFKETMLPWAFLLAQAGYRVVLVDLRGHGGSTGDTVSFGKYETADLVQMLDDRQQRGLCPGKVGVLGYSLGANLALHWAAHDPRVGTVVAIAPYNLVEEAMQRLAREMGIPISARVAHSALDLVATKLVLDWNDWSGVAAARGLKVPVLLAGGAKDSISRPADIAALQAAAPAGSRTMVVPIATHEVLALWLHEFGDPVKQWFGDHLIGEK
jgi:pimeloyl-ACP methyl ester carboxylesterase